jgi:hypothetical protein
MSIDVRAEIGLESSLPLVVLGMSKLLHKYAGVEVEVFGFLNGLRGKYREEEVFEFKTRRHDLCNRGLQYKRRKHEVRDPRLQHG